MYRRDFWSTPKGEQIVELAIGFGVSVMATAAIAFAITMAGQH